MIHPLDDASHRLCAPWTKAPWPMCHVPESQGQGVLRKTSFDSKQPKLEPKLVSALSETKPLFRLFRFCTETASFGVSIKPKQTVDKPKQTEKGKQYVLYSYGSNSIKRFLFFFNVSQPTAEPDNFFFICLHCDCKFVTLLNIFTK